MIKYVRRNEGNVLNGKKCVCVVRRLPRELLRKSVRGRERGGGWEGVKEG